MCGDHLLMVLSDGARARLAAQAAAGRVPVQRLTVAQARRRQAEEAAERARPVEPVARVQDGWAEGPTGRIAYRLYHPDGDQRPPALVFFHGGGWVLGGIAYSDAICRRLANASACAVVSVEYRLAPENPFPAGLDDAWAATCWVARSGDVLQVDTDRIAVGGDSAGGNLAAVVAMRAREAGSPALALQALIYPVTACDPRTASLADFAEGYGLEADGMRWYWDHYGPPGIDRNGDELSPLLADDLSGLPPALVVTAEYDPLRDEGEQYAARLQEAGVPVTLKRYPGAIHGFLDCLGEAREADDAMSDIAAHLRALRGGTSPMSEGGRTQR